ncbi:MAG: rRNA biogenesis protein [Candidatus Methanoperedens sp.]|nr:rRNA biogenesis protein [Candidatus Methanoperedens sp.]MCZ7369105.1 rRNA biogenesis protein [Candidatus Methanoperedens sp.]
MQTRTWFGIFSIDENGITGVELFQKDIETLLSRLTREPLMMVGKVAGTNLRDLGLKYGFVSSNEEYDHIFHELNIGLVKKQLTKAVTRDRQISAAIETIDEINETGNVLGERLKEWYIMNFGETDLMGGELARYILGIKGSHVEPELQMMQSLAATLLGLYESRLSMEKYLKNSMPQLAPNLTNIAGYLLGARLIRIAGGLGKLASMPSSTVQVIGANSALFKHLKGKAPSPKHGVIFRHPYINNAPKWQRGKIARTVASKISLAARYDYYSGELVDSLAYGLEKKVMEIKKRYPRPRKE